MERRYSPVYEIGEYVEVLAGVPFIRSDWTLERQHEMEELRRGEWMLLALCLGVDGPRGIARHNALVNDIGFREADLARLPADGIGRRELHARLDDILWAAAAVFADWLADDTGACFLDFTDEFAILDNDAWDADYLADLAAQWRRAEDFQARITVLCACLEEARATPFAAPVDAAALSCKSEQPADA